MNSPGAHPRALDRIRAAAVAFRHGAGFTGVTLAGLGLLAITVGALTGTATGFGLALAGPSWEPGKERLALLVAMTLVLVFVLPLLLSGVLAGIRALASLTRRLSAQWCGVPIAEPYLPGPSRGGLRRRLTWQLSDRATWRDLRWTAVNVCVGWIFTAVPVVLAVVGLISIVQQNQGGPLAGGPSPLAGGHAQRTILGLALLAASGLAAPGLLRGYCGLARTMLGPSDSAELQRRVAHLSQTRSETIDTGAAEIRRIERDLHDGAQARLVAMGMTLDAAGQLIDDNPLAARALLIEARDNSAKALAELRALVRGIHPPVLADRGLAEAIRALALDTPLRIHLAADLDGRPPAPVESAAYFAVSELLANVSKHAAASQVWVDIRYADGMLKTGVTDDGHGGADPDGGTGLHGIERRLAAFDGVLAISSPPGGPTTVTMEVPCALSSPKTSFS